MPEITKIEDTEGIDFIIMGCDGVWDCVKRQMVCEFIEKEINEHPEKNLSEILKKIFDRCVSPVRSSTRDRQYELYNYSIFAQ